MIAQVLLGIWKNHEGYTQMSEVWENLDQTTER